MLAGYGTKEMKSKVKKKENAKKVYLENGFWRFEGAHQGYNTKENAEAALAESEK